jgi:hypothetical protein
VPERLFVFIQFEFPWVLGPAEGRYLLRDGEDGEPQRVVVLGTLDGAGPGSARATRREARASLRERWRERGVGRPASAEPAAVSTTRATVIDPVSLSAENQARAWLEDLDREREVLAATAVLNRVVHAHRLASADPYVREVSPAQAIVIRAGWGEGEQVADGAWLHARELPWRAAGGRRRGGRRDRSAALRPQERLAAVLGGRHEMLLCEELVLRARLDLDQGRPAHAAIQLDAAYAAAIGELAGEERPDLALRAAELEKLRPQVAALAQAALAREGAQERGPGEPAAIDEEALEHALVRLEAALRARVAAGFNLP